MYTLEAVDGNLIHFEELKYIPGGTVAKVYMDEFNHLSDFHTIWKKLYDIYLRKGAKTTLTAENENMIHNLKYVMFFFGFMLTTYVEQHKTSYQAMLAFTKKTDHVEHDPKLEFVILCFMNIMDPVLSQTMLFLATNQINMLMTLMQMSSTLVS